ncbi:TPA: hypothetical protein DIV49_01275 [Candidatus Saccharibacteria bacterium]|nr:hypothetical protein [Candidatus Saccharibacteria bacterium]HRJ90976.1 hypothetical protein [Candidatus Saccharibacteria bacterium]
MTDNQQPLTDDEINAVASQLQRLPRGYLPLPIFWSVANLVTTPTMEVAPLRNTADGLEIYLTQRPENDPHWPSGWHIPGTVIRSTDEEGSLASGFARVLKDELGEGIRYVGEPVQVTTKFWDVTRGRELDLVHYIEVEVIDDTKLTGQFFPVNSLPESTLEHHKIMIPEIVAAYEAAKSSAS